MIGYAMAQGKRSFAALIPDNAYGTVVQAAFQQAVARGGGRVVAMERYPLDRAQMQGPVPRVAQAARQVDSIFIPDGADSVSAAVQALTAGGVNMRRLQLDRHRTVGRRSAHQRRAGRAGRLVRGARIRPDSAPSRAAIVRATGRIRCARRRSPMTRCRWSPRW